MQFLLPLTYLTVGILPGILESCCSWHFCGDPGREPVAEPRACLQVGGRIAPHPYRAVFCVLWVGLAGQGEAPEGPCSCDFSTVGLGFFPAPLASPGSLPVLTSCRLGLGRHRGTYVVPLSRLYPHRLRRSLGCTAPRSPSPRWPGPLGPPFLTSSLVHNEQPLLCPVTAASQPAVSAPLPRTSWGRA